MCSHIVLAINEVSQCRPFRDPADLQQPQHLGFEDVQSFVDASEGGPLRIHLCNPNMMALENTSVAFSHLNVPGIFTSQQSLEVTVEDSDENAKSSPVSEDDDSSEEDWEREVIDDGSSSDNAKSASTFTGSWLSPVLTDKASAEDNSNDLSDAFTPVSHRHKKSGQVSKMGVRLAVVSSGEFAKIHKPTLKSEKQRAVKYNRAAYSLKATPTANPSGGSSGGATYKEIDYQNMKKLNPRPCHKHYLAVNGCPSQDRCNFGHHYQLTKSELLAIRVLAREMCCPYYLAGKCPHDVSNSFGSIHASCGHRVVRADPPVFSSNIPASMVIFVPMESESFMLSLTPRRSCTD